MCNEAARRITLGQLRDDFSELRIPLHFPEGLPNMEPLDSVRITDPTVVVRAAGIGEAEIVTRRWSWPGQGGRPIYNYRSEGRSFANTATGGRCLIPVDSFFEFTAPEPGTKRKTKWRFSPVADPFLCIAGLWRIDPTVGEAFTMLTTDPGPDIAPYHHRQIVLMPRLRWADWLAGTVPAADLIAPTPAGTLAVTPA